MRAGLEALAGEHSVCECAGAWGCEWAAGLPEGPPGSGRHPPLRSHLSPPPPPMAPHHPRREMHCPSLRGRMVAWFT